MDTTIDLRLFATLGVYAPANASQLPIICGTTVAQLIASLQIPPDAAKLIFVNGVRADFGTHLKGGERVGIFPPVGGG